VVEYPLFIVLVCFLRPHWSGAQTALETEARNKPRGRRGRTRGSLLRERLSAYGTVAWALFGLWTGAVMYAASYADDPNLLRHIERNFFGVLSIRVDTFGECLNLEHGTTIHGMQSLDPSRREEPLGYYYRDGPIGQVFTALPAETVKQPVGVIGLGIGALAAYAKPGQQWTFFEIDQAVKRIAQDERYFTYLRDAVARGAAVHVELGDARLRLAETNDRYGLFVLDAFSSDAIPMHLVTREALALYLRHLEPDGVLAFHISSRYLRIEPVLGDLARDAGMVCLFQETTDLSVNDFKYGKKPSRWVVMARRAEALGSLASDDRWKALRARPGRRVWTDGYSDFLSVVAWQGERASGRVKR
jgi:SAM-dependent methyltransferase